MTLQTCSPPVVMKMDAPSSKATCVLVKLKSLSWVVCLVLIHMSECPKTHIFFPPPSLRLPVLHASVSTGKPQRDPWPRQMLLEDGISLPSLFLPAAKVTGCLSPSDHKSPFYPSLCLYLPLQTPANKSLGLRKVEPERWKAGRAVHGGAEQKMSSPARTSDKQTQTEVRKPCVWVQPWDLNLRNVTHTHARAHSG